jgi:hypothetical protein
VDDVLVATLLLDDGYLVERAAEPVHVGVCPNRH